MIDLNRRPRMGLLLISPERFQTIGEGTARGSYKERKQKEAEWMAKEASAIAEVTFPGVIYTAEDVKRAIDAFVTAKVDYVLAIYLSWAEDFAWIRFLRDMPACPVLFCHRMRDKIELKDTHDDDEFAEYLCCGGLGGSPAAPSSGLTGPCWKSTPARGRRCWPALRPSETPPGPALSSGKAPWVCWPA